MLKERRITAEMLREMDACESAYEKFCERFPSDSCTILEGMQWLKDIHRSDYYIWLICGLANNCKNCRNCEQPAELWESRCTNCINYTLEYADSDTYSSIAVWFDNHSAEEAATRIETLMDAIEISNTSEQE